jgi:hypothetical protein
MQLGDQPRAERCSLLGAHGPRRRTAPTCERAGLDRWVSPALQHSTPSQALVNLLELVARPHRRIASPIGRLRLRRIEINLDLDAVGIGEEKLPGASSRARR